ncbi:hypothetical protein SAMN05880582_107187 [Rhizobium sp. RU20A]|nr:hypothetical protein SAMN05880582_107187 [Rhizobium sp. RU20A]
MLRKESIPTPVGDPFPTSATMPPRRVYPHACGGSYASWCVKHGFMGLSPRLWGIRRRARNARLLEGSIPTPVGDPGWPKHAAAGDGVYPHACGGSRCGTSLSAGVQGLSPRLWGIPEDEVTMLGPLGSIPTPVGDPGNRGRGAGAGRVYPHACGGSREVAHMARPAAGLSPRLWGIRPLCAVVVAPGGSIPTPVGDPHDQFHHVISPGVYPHACGGSISAA